MVSTVSKQPLWIGYLAFAAFGAYEGLIGVAWPSMRATFALSLDAIGGLFLVGLVGFVLLSFSSGWIIRRSSLYALLLASSLARSSGLLLMALAPRWEGVLVGGFLASMGAGGIDPTVNGHVTSYHSARQLNWLHASFGVGATLGPFLVAALLANQLSWRWTFGLLAAVQALSIWLIWRSAPAWRVAAAAPAAGSAPAGSLWAMLRLPVVWLSVLIFFVYTGVEVSTGQWSYSLLTLGRGIDPIVASTWVSLYWGSFTLGRIVFGFIVERINVQRFLRAALVAASLGAGLLWLNPAAWLGLLGLALTGLALAPVFPVLIATTPQRVSAGQVANTLGFQIAAAGLGGSLLSSLTGVLADSVSLESIAAFIFALLLAMLVIYETLQWLTHKPRLRGHVSRDS